MNNWIRLFVSPRGRIGRRTFWHGVMVVTLANVVLISLAAVVAGRSASAGFSLVALTPLLTAYPTVCVYTKRLHDLGHSGWLQAPPRLLWAIALPSLALSIRSDTSGAAIVLAIVALTLALLMDGVLLAWLGFRRGAGNLLEAFD